MSHTTPSTVPMTGIIMRYGSGFTETDPEGKQSGTVTYPDHDLRSVHPSRRDEAIAYRITSDGQGAHLTTKDGDVWTHYRYTFQYRYMGRTFQMQWHCGTMYGTPKATDGLHAAFQDVGHIEHEAFGPEWMDDLGYDYETDYAKAERDYRAAERLNERLDHLFGDAEERERWAQRTHEQ